MMVLHGMLFFLMLGCTIKIQWSKGGNRTRLDFKAGFEGCIGSWYRQRSGRYDKVFLKLVEEEQDWLLMIRI